MEPSLPGVGPLSGAEVERVLAAAIAAPSLHNSQPWRFALQRNSIELRADLDRTLPATDPDGRALRLACGAALFNLRTAVSALGWGAAIDVNRSPGDAELLARITPLGPRPAPPEDVALAQAIPRRRTARRPMTSTRLPPGTVEELRRAARREGCLMVLLRPEAVETVRRLTTTAHRLQLADPGFRREWRAWTGRGDGTADGVPLTAGGNLPPPGERLVVRDFTAGTGREPPPDRGFEADPSLGVLGTFHDLPAGWLQAGQALERVLLTATAGGLATGFVSAPIEVPAVRAELRTALGDALFPQMVLRFGQGPQPTSTPRRPLREVVVVGGDRSQ